MDCQAKINSVDPERGDLNMVGKTRRPGTGIRLGVDVGGTFTDLALIDDSTGRVTIHKLLTTPQDPSIAMLQGARELLGRSHVAASNLTTIVHGTTLITNSVIERKGAPVGMLVTRGFRDILDIGKEQRYDVYDLRLSFPKPLIPRVLRREIHERVEFDGNVESTVNEDEVRVAVADLVENHKIEGIAICLLQSYLNPHNEQRIKELLIREYPGLCLSISSEVSPFIREFERWTTTTVNAYVQPLVDRYLTRLEVGLKELGFHGDLSIMTSNGGTATPNTARLFPVRLIESGPAAGALMSAYHSKLLQVQNVLSFDMGGTTAKGTIVQGGEPHRRNELEVAHAHHFRKGSGFPLKIPSIDMIEIGAGGGSIAAPDHRGVIAVGPQSAGARPGPVCYDQGGVRSTLTDANLILGYLDPEFFLGGTMRLNKPDAVKVVAESIARPLNLDAARAAWGIHETTNEDVARAFRVHAAARGFDYRQSAMIAFGGCGPLHATRIARKLRIPRVVFPVGAGVMSAFGLLVSGSSFEIIRTEKILLNNLSATNLAMKFKPLIEEASRYLRESGVSNKVMSFRFRLDMRYQWQGHEIEISLPPNQAIEAAFSDLPEIFAAQYARVFSMSFLEQPLEIVNWKVEASGPAPRMGQQGFFLESFVGATHSSKQALKGTRSAYFPDREGFLDCPVYDRYKLAIGTQLHGPALIEENESTCVIGSGDHLHVDDKHNLVADLAA